MVYRCGVIWMALLMGISASLAAPPAPPTGLKAALAEDMNQLEREIAALMMSRNDVSGDKRLRVESQIDLRIIRRVITAMAADAKPESKEQVALWLRSRQLATAGQSTDEILNAATWTASASQKTAIAALNKLSFTTAEIKGLKELDDYCARVASALANIANPTPVDPRTFPVMRPKPLTDQQENPNPVRGQPLAELTQQVQRLAAISVPLRQQLLGLVSAAGAKDGDASRELLEQAIGLAQGLQSNTAVSPENRTAIETQLAEGIALFGDPRTRDFGKDRIDSLGAYREVLGRLGKLSLTREQMQQLGPALTWAASAGDPGLKYMGTIEQYMQQVAKWDALPTTGLLPTMRKPLEDLATQFTRQRNAFWQEAARSQPSPESLQAQLEDMKRTFALAEDLRTMGQTLETINAFKPKPAGMIEKKVQVAATAVTTPSRTANRNDAERYLAAVRQLARRAQSTSAASLKEIPAAVAQTWAGGKLDAFETRQKALLTELASSLATGAMELDKVRLAKLEAANDLVQSLRLAAQLETALPATASLNRWADWAITAEQLTASIGTYRETLSGAFVGYAGDHMDAVDRWQKLSPRFVAIATLVVRDAGYADQCQAMPIGLPGDLARLATRVDGEPFAAERYASFAMASIAALEKAGDTDAAEKTSITLAKRLAKDLQIVGSDERPRRR